MKHTSAILCLLCLAPVTRHGAETLLELSRRSIKHPPALMSPSTRAEADALMRPKVSLLPPVSKALTSRAVTHPPPTNQVNVTVTWNDAPVPLYPVMIPSSNNLTAPLTSGAADFLSVIQGPTNSVRLVGLLVASTNGWRSQYQVTPDMPYAASNAVVRRMIQNEQMKAGYKWTP